jgi:hypothetical protein
VGDYEEGPLWVQNLGSVGCKHRWVSFDGNVPHCTMPYTGTRYTFIYFAQQSFARLGAARPHADDRAVRGPLARRARSALGTATQCTRRNDSPPPPPQVIAQDGFPLPPRVRRNATQCRLADPLCMLSGHGRRV